MAIRLSTTLGKISSVPNPDNSRIIRDFYEYMKANGTSENYQNQNLKAMIVFAHFLGPINFFFDVKSKQQISAFLDTKIRDYNIDLDKKWITTWNDYPWRIKYLLRWLHNHKEKEEKGMEPLQQSDWTTPPFANIKKKKTKRLSP
jgi:integrase/recombinase XerD